MKFSLKKDGKRILFVCVAAVIMALNIKSFVRTGGLYPGGATGISLLIQRVAQLYFDVEVPYTIINLLLNAFPVYIGFRYIGKKFTLYSCLMIVLTSVLTDLLPGYIITYDTLLISIFGGIINGFVISLCLSVNATSGGTDFIGIYLSERKGIDSWNMVLAINVVILSLAGILFGWDKALYSIIFQFASTQVLHIRYKRYQKHTLLVVTNHPQEVANTIYDTSHHGATIIQAEGSYGHNERDIVYSVVSAEESRAVIKAVKALDPKAFVNVLKTEQVEGVFYHRPND